MEFWKEQLEDGDLDQFHWINESAYLSVADLMSIAREVW
jgi:micrococcal nuclease